MREVTAAGGVVYRIREERPEVLLIYRNDVWDLPKGKQESGESTEACARREVAEEIGIPLPDIESFLIKTYHEYHRDGELNGKTTYWYCMPSAAEVFTPQHAEGITDVQWVRLEEGLKKVGFDNLRDVLQAFAARIEKK